MFVLVSVLFSTVIVASRGGPMCTPNPDCTPGGIGGRSWTIYIYVLNCPSPFCILLKKKTKTQPTNKPHFICLVV